MGGILEIYDNRPMGCPMGSRQPPPVPKLTNHCDWSPRGSDTGGEVVGPGSFWMSLWTEVDGSTMGTPQTFMFRGYNPYFGG